MAFPIHCWHQISHTVRKWSWTLTIHSFGPLTREPQELVTLLLVTDKYTSPSWQKNCVLRILLTAQGWRRTGLQTATNSSYRNLKSWRLVKFWGGSCNAQVMWRGEKRTEEKVRIFQRNGTKQNNAQAKWKQLCPDCSKLAGLGNIWERKCESQTVKGHWTSEVRWGTALCLMMTQSFRRLLWPFLDGIQIESDSLFTFCSLWFILLHTAVS